MNKLSFSAVTLEVLPEVARDIIAELGDKKVILFYGEMGSGKTTLIKEMCRQLGVTGNMSSPTFGLVNEYSIPSGKIYHFDLYRVKNLEECLDMGMEEYLYSGNYCFIEWPDVARDLVPAQAVKISIEANKDQRTIFAQ
jgi:tRNA threonylcarbamoyladenosine biosynthesis protein TsaE